LTNEDGAAILLHARKYAAAFYTVMDYQVVGDEFTEVGIPHFMMEKEIPKK
jgi:predicted GNAT family N-acyltransferase